MLRIFIFFSLLLLAGCKPKPTPRQATIIPDTTAGGRKVLSYKPAEVIGNWHSHSQWNNREVTLKVRPDSTLVFIGKAMEKDTSYLVAIGDWVIVDDTLLVMKLIKDGRTYQPDELFPELYANGATPKVVSAPITASFIIGDAHLYNLTKANTRDTSQYYDRIK
ncbi:MAG: hypothetical protein IM638_08260 [Bacteroidetes bacterium]|nr:hypothetical protein [Bacteroidota bacterium]